MNIVPALASALKISLSKAWSNSEEGVKIRPIVRECILNIDILSQFELLPRELIWPIIEYAPESTSLLRLTSRVIQSKVDEYARQRVIIRMIEDMRFVETKGWWPQILVDVPARKSTLFELHLAFRLVNATKITRVCRGNDKHPSVYKLELHELLYDTFIQEIFGKRLRKVWLFNLCGRRPLASIAELLAKFEFDRLSVTVDFLSMRMTTFIVDTVEKHRVEQLTISVLGDTACCAETLLLHISSFIRSLHICQARFVDVSSDRPFLLGADSSDGGWTILNMFSRKLDKLLIDNSHYPKYLTKESSDLLIKYLPELGKKVWFEITCENYEDDNRTRNNHSIRDEGSAVPHSRLRIKHVERENEQFYSNSN